MLVICTDGTVMESANGVEWTPRTRKPEPPAAPQEAPQIQTVVFTAQEIEVMANLLEGR